MHNIYHNKEEEDKNREIARFLPQIFLSYLY